MAERAAHLTATSHTKPSIFEVVAQDSLTVTFHPALKRVAMFLASCNPEKYGWLIGWFEEVYFAFNTILQYCYLKCHGASFAEAFYGLQRVPLRGISLHCPRLPPHEEAVSLLCLCVVPYLRTKLEDKVTQYQLQGTSEGWVRLHSVLHSVWEGCVLGNYLCYMNGSTASHSPLLHLAGVTLQYTPEQTHESKFPLLSAKFVGYLLMHTLEFGAFFLQFLQWWHSEDKLRTSLTALPVPPPCKVSAEARQYGRVCPICLQNWKIETVLSVSGWLPTFQRRILPPLSRCRYFEDYTE
ncbi:peroxisome assembly protein 12 isoform X2 [Zootermopsis nevadensis]|uniref:peroxisome assembly protein 12 isoform X2 n=1 Tax=Zootermopsis nevadensis TaxID=136037 RepID=UPI000B8E2AD6|nr:peroxisome assembly protein 12 isoform X2 [Zootermopsis nevadensis]